MTIKDIPPQEQQHQPGVESEMTPKPEAENKEYRGSNKLENKVAVITGGDSGIGRAVAIVFAKEGADIVISYFEEDNDANETKALVEKEGRRCICIAGDIGDEKHCNKIIETTIHEFNKIDILVNNAAEHYPQKELEEISAQQLEHTFRVNLFSYFYMTKAVLPHLKKGASIINTASVVAYKGHPELIDYASTKGAIVTFTRSLAVNLAKKEIRVNAVAPGPIWTPLIPASFDAEKVASFGKDVPLGRVGQPDEVAPCYVFLAANVDSSYITGQVLHPNGGVIVNG